MGVVNLGIVRGKPAYCPDGGPINRLAPSRNTLMTILSRDVQISPDKNVNFPYTNADIYPAPRTCGLCCVVPTRPGAKPSMRFLSPGSGPGQAPAQTLAPRLPSDGWSPSRPCLRLVPFVSLTSAPFQLKIERSDQTASHAV